MEIHVTFRIMGLFNDLSAITHMMSTPPDIFHVAGDLRIGKNGRTYSPYSESLWAIKSIASTDGNLHDHIALLLSRLSIKLDSINQISHLGHRADILIGIVGDVSNVAFELPAETLCEIGKLNLALNFDVYCAVD